MSIQQQPESSSASPVRSSDEPRTSRERRGRGLAGLSAVAVLAAVLASGGTVAALHLADGPAQVSVQQQSGAAGAGQTSDTGSTITPASLGTIEDWSGVAAEVAPSVVSITARSGQGEGSGSGVVWDAGGHIVTNAHVVAGATEVAVTLSDGRQYDAEVIGTDATTDLAVLSLASVPEDLIPISRAEESQDLAVGSPVMAIGNPLGLSGTVTTGIVSALDRPVTTQSSDPDPASATAVVTNAIQTSAPINPGNSGGALVDAAGDLIGINTAIASLGSASGTAGSIGIGFAIPASTASSVADQLIEDGTATHALLGVRIEDTQIEQGGARLAVAAVADVDSGSAAADAGLAAGDAIIAIDGRRVEGALSLVGQVRAMQPGTTVELTIVRDGSQSTVQVTLQPQT